jgi:hypothetical protein
VKQTTTSVVDFNQPDAAKRVGTDLETTATSLAVRVRETPAVVDKASLEQAVLDRQSIGEAIGRVEDFFKPLKGMAYQLWQALIAREKEILTPLRAVDCEKVDAIKAFNEAEERDRRRREAEEAAQRLRDYQAQAADEAAALEQQGEKELAAAVVAEAIAAPLPVVTLPSQTAGVVTFTRYWKWKYAGGPVDISKTPPEIVRRSMALIPEEFKCVDEKKVGSYARSMKTSGRIPGIDIYATQEPRR